jgi:hypothetical protein
VAVSFVDWGRGLATLLLFLYVTKEAGRIYVRDMPWPLAAECNMITNKQTNNRRCLITQIYQASNHITRDAKDAKTDVFYPE